MQMVIGYNHMLEISFAYLQSIRQEELFFKSIENAIFILFYLVTTTETPTALEPVCKCAWLARPQCCCRPPHGALEPHLQTGNSRNWSKEEEREHHKNWQSIGPTYWHRWQQTLIRTCWGQFMTTKQDITSTHPHQRISIYLSWSTNYSTMHVFSMNHKAEVISISRHLLQKVPFSWMRTRKT